jgi:rhamnose transport system substrate-binding protein
MTKISLIRTLALVCTLTFLGTVGNSQDKPIKKDLKITAIPKNINNPYMVIQSGGAMDACKEMGCEGKVVGPSEAGASAQVSYINTAITQRQNAILIAANDPNALVPYLKKAMSQKITVVTLDSDTAPEGRNVFINQASAEGIGQSLVQTLAKQMGGSGDFASEKPVCSRNLGFQATNEWRSKSTIALGMANSSKIAHNCCKFWVERSIPN